MTKDIKRARAEADAARARLNDTIAALRYRTTPAVIAHDVAGGAYDRFRQAMVTGNAAMRTRPWLPWAIGSAIGGIAALRSTRRRRPNNSTGAVN